MAAAPAGGSESTNSQKRADEWTMIRNDSS
jgi:hypothetical protein